MNNVLIFILLCISAVLIIYVIIIHIELKHIEKEMDYIKETESNMKLDSKYGIKCINKIIEKINDNFDDSRKFKASYENKSKTLTKMMTNIAHDLRTPLTSALGYIDIIQNPNLTEKEKKQEIKVIEERLERLKELINSFFEFSKVISAGNKLDLEKVNLIEILEDCIIGYYEVYASEQREIKYECSERKIIVNSNRIFLTRIFNNLIGNAHKHSSENLEITVFKIHSHIKIDFKNKMTEGDVDTDKMFDEFYTSDISRTKGGTGLGLAIAKEFTNELGGNISACKQENYLIISVEFTSCDLIQNTER